MKNKTYIYLYILTILKNKYAIHIWSGIYVFCSYMQVQFKKTVSKIRDHIFYSTENSLDNNSKIAKRCYVLSSFMKYMVMYRFM